MSNVLLLEMRKKKTMHILHLILSVLTGGFWLIIWLLCGISNALENSKIDKQINQILASEKRV